MENKCKGLLDKNDKLMKQFTVQLHVQGAKHIIWDMIIAEAGKLRPYLNYILDKELVMQDARETCTSVKEVLNKNPIYTTNNTISFLNGLTEDDLKAAGIKDIISIITWERKVLVGGMDACSAEAAIWMRKVHKLKDGAQDEG